MKEEQTKEEFFLKDCSIICQEKDIPCPFSECKNWIEFKEDHNCDLISIQKNGEMTLREVGDRMGISYVRVKQIESAAIKKIKSFTVEELLAN